MTTEQLQQAKQLEKRINDLKSFIEPLEIEKFGKLNLEVGGYKNEEGTGYLSKAYSSYYNDCPDFLKDQLEDDLLFIVSRTIHRVKKEIKKLEKELSDL